MKILFCVVALFAFSAVHAGDKHSSQADVCTDCGAGAPVDWEKFRDDRLGNCVQPPDFLDLMNQWKRFQFVANLRIKLNFGRLAQMPVKDETKQFVRDLQNISEFMKALSTFQSSKYFQNLARPKGQIDEKFLAFAKSKEFLNALASPCYVAEKTSPECSSPDKINNDKFFRADYDDGNHTEFRTAVTVLQKNLNDVSVRASVERVMGLDRVDPIDVGINVFQPSAPGAYNELMASFWTTEDKNGDVKALLRGGSQIPVQSRIPIPKAGSNNPFLKQYLTTVQNGVEDFLFHEPVGDPASVGQLKKHLKDKLATGETLESALGKIEKRLRKEDEEREKEKQIANAMADDPSCDDAAVAAAEAARLESEKNSSARGIASVSDRSSDGDSRMTPLIDAFNHARAPTTHNVFDEHIVTQYFTGVKTLNNRNKAKPGCPRKKADAVPSVTVHYDGKDYNVTAADMAQITVVAQTLAGEVNVCEEKGVHQAEAVGLVIARRMKAIQSAYADNAQVSTGNNKVFSTKDIETLYSENPDADFGKLSVSQLRGAVDFGRPPNPPKVNGQDAWTPFPTSLDRMPAAEVVTREKQFSVWDPHTSKSYKISQFGKLPPNIPDHKFNIYGPLAGEDLHAQIRTLCPEIPKNTLQGKAFNSDDDELWHSDFKRTQPIWNHVSELAFQIVKDTDNYLRRYDWKPNPQSNQQIYFYTHGLNLGFAQRVPASLLRDNQEKKDLKLGPCRDFQLFSPQNVRNYEKKK